MPNSFHKNALPIPEVLDGDIQGEIDNLRRQIIQIQKGYKTLTSYQNYGQKNPALLWSLTKLLEPLQLVAQFTFRDTDKWGKHLQVTYLQYTLNSVSLTLRSEIRQWLARAKLISNLQSKFIILSELSKCQKVKKLLNVPDFLPMTSLNTME